MINGPLSTGAKLQNRARYGAVFAYKGLAYEVAMTWRPLIDLNGD